MKLVGNVEIENVEKIKSGKVREMFAFEDRILIVTNDRISAFEFLKNKSIELYNVASRYAMDKGIIIADTKFEFGASDDEIILVDEVLTPDSSRFWPLDDYEPGRPQKSFDKQYVRDYLLSTDWDRKSAPPELPDDIIKKTIERYIAAYEKLIGKKFAIK